jgi:membrane protease YdiL (CAAX protease family)
MNDSLADPLHARRWFWWACGFETLLAVLALALGSALHVPTAASFHWSTLDAVWGLAGTLPLLGLLAILIGTRAGWMQEIVRFLDRSVRPIFGQWSLLQLAILSALAGIGEELLFRGLVQEGCDRLIGPWAGLIVASLLFGSFHWITRGYALLAGSIGLYLGLLWMLSGNLLVPIITHGAYDFLALVYFLRIRAG